MGITVSPATSASGGGGGTSLPVVPGTSVEQEIYTDIGFATGDYVYRYGRGNVGALSFPISVPVASSVIPVNGTTTTVTIASASVAKSSFTAPQLIPSTVTYSGSSTTLGTNVLAQTVISASASSLFPEIAVLTNGNMVSVFSSTTTSTLFYQITTPAGVAVANGTVATNMRNNSGVATPYHVCALNAGGFIVAFETTSGNANTVVYTAAGVVSRGAASSGMSGSYHPYLAVSATDQVYLSCNGGINGNSANYLASLTAAGSVITQVVPSGGGYYPIGKVPIAVNSNGLVGGVISDNGSSTGNTVAYAFVYTAALGSMLTGTTFNGPYTQVPSVAVTTSNYFVFCALDGSSYPIFLWYNPAGSFGNPYTLSGYTTGNSAVKLIPYSGGSTASTTSTTNGVMLLHYYGSNTYVTPFSITSTSLSPGSAASLSTAQGTPGIAGISGAQLLNGNLVIAYRTATPDSAMKTFNAFTLANGTVGTTPANLYPNYVNGYRLLGVATTTAAAGTTGTIAINGQAPLAATYGTSSTPVGFDYNPKNTTGMSAGNSGYVVNRMVILKGLEQ
jgi:hypothetical protein